MPDIVNVAKEYGLSSYQIDNLYTLARFLASEEIPPPQFAIVNWMNVYSGDEGGFMTGMYSPYKAHEHYHECKTTACAVGHGPLAGIPAKKGEDWWMYSNRVFGTSAGRNSDVFQFLFDGGWDKNKVEDTAKVTAQRIFYFLKYGLPLQFRPTMFTDPKPWHGIDLVTESL